MKAREQAVQGRGVSYIFHIKLLDDGVEELRHVVIGGIGIALEIGCHDEGLEI